MSEATATPIPHLLRRMKEFGYTPRYVREKLLPTWWRDETARTKAGLLHGVLLLADRTGLDPLTLLDNETALAFADSLPRRFKKKADIKADKCIVSSAIAVQVGTLIADALPTPYKPLPPTPAAIRATVQKAFPGAVTLETLLSWCWLQGVPVIHVAELPTHKPQALAFLTPENRPVIVLCEKRKSPSHLAFLLAHELTHIACGHLEKQGGLHWDTDNSLAETSGEENEANNGAREILTGDPHFVRKFMVITSADEKAALARESAAKIGVDPGVVLNNIAFHNPKDRLLALAALKIVEGSTDGTRTVNALAGVHIAWDDLPDDAEGFLINVCGESVHGVVPTLG